MALARGVKGQAATMFLGAAFTDGTGLAVDPTGTPQVQVFHVQDPLVLKATLNLTQQAGITGFWGAFLDISNGTTYPAGDYQVVATPTVAAIATVLTDNFEIDETAPGASGGFITDAYASEAQIRGVSKVLAAGGQGSASITSPLVLDKAVEAARWIDGKLRVLYAVPFAIPPDETLTLMSMYLAAADLLDYARGAGDDTVAFAAELRARVDTMIADLISGVAILGVDPISDAASGSGVAASSTEGVERVFDRFESTSPLSRY